MKRALPIYISTLGLLFILIAFPAHAVAPGTVANPTFGPNDDNVTSLIGPTGLTGPTGPKGETGDKGDSGDPFIGGEFTGDVTFDKNATLKGKVGIGAANAGDRALFVAGSIGAAWAEIGTVPSQPSTLNIGPGQSGWPLLSLFGGTGAEVLRVTNTGNVGIGSAPGSAYKLDVGGKANVTEICIAGDCRSSWAAAIGGAPTLQQVTDATNGTTTTRTIRVGGLEGGDVRLRGDNTSGKLYFSDTGTDKYIGIKDWWTELGVHTNEGFRIRRNDNQLLFQVSGGSGNVGIGTGATGPGGKLQVNGSATNNTTNPTIRVSGDGTQSVLNMGLRYGSKDNAWIDGSGALTLNPFSGNVGIGALEPGAKLEVAGQVKITGGSPGTGKVLTSDGAGLASWQSIPATNVPVTSVFGRTGAVTAQPNDYNTSQVPEAGSNQYFTNARATAAVQGQLDAKAPLANPRFTGTVGIGAGSPGYPLDVAGTVNSLGLRFQDQASSHINADGALYRFDGQAHLSVDDNFYIRDSNDGRIPFVFQTDVGSIIASGPITASAFFYSSDAALKKDIRPIPDAIQLIEALQGNRFSWKASGQPSYGFIAQDVERVLPELVQTNETTGQKSVEYAKVIPILVEAVKEQQKQIQTLQEKLEMTNDHE